LVSIVKKANESSKPRTTQESTARKGTQKETEKGSSASSKTFKKQEVKPKHL